MNKAVKVDADLTQLVLVTYYHKLDGVFHRKEIMIKPVKKQVTDISSLDELYKYLDDMASSYNAWSLESSGRKLLAYKNETA